MKTVSLSLLIEITGVMDCGGWMTVAEVRRAYASSVGSPPDERRLRRHLEELAEQDILERRRTGWYVSYRYNGWPPPLA